MWLGNFFRDYGAVAGSAAPAIAAYIAMLIAQYYKDRPIAKALLMIAAGLLVVASIVVNAEYQHQIVADKKFETTRRMTIREGLGKLIEDGQNLQNRCADATVLLPAEAVIDWDMRARAFLSENLGASYVTRFGDSIGATPLVVPSMSDDRRSLFIGLYVRIFRLEQFSQQLPI